jgi:hypothetical protein
MSIIERQRHKLFDLVGSTSKAFTPIPPCMFIVTRARIWIFCETSLNLISNSVRIREIQVRYDIFPPKPHCRTTNPSFVTCSTLETCTTMALLIGSILVTGTDYGLGSSTVEQILHQKDRQKTILAFTPSVKQELCET